MDIQLKLNDSKRGAFFIEKDGVEVAKMEIGISGENMTVYHTEVSETLKGQGIASKLLEEMVRYARANNLKVIALCAFVNAQFKRHPEQYADIWNQDWHQNSPK